MPNDSISTQSAAPESSPTSSTTTETNSAPTQSSQTSPAQTELSGLVPDDPTVGGFEGLGGDFEALDQIIESTPNPVPQTKPAVAPAASVPAPAQVAPAEQKPQAAPAPVAPPAPPAATPPAASPAAEAAPSQTNETAPAGIDDVLNALKADQGNIRSNIVNSFALTNEQAAALEARPMETVPELLADSYLRAVDTSLQYMKHLVPTMVTKILSQIEVAKQSEQEFFSMWPSLDRGKHANDIRNFANAFVQANPNIDRKTLFSLVGPAVMAKYGIQPNATQAAHQPPAQPSYAPVRSSAPVVVQTQQIAESPFEGLGQDYDG